MNNIKRRLFGILNLGYCDLFGICYLLFVNCSYKTGQFHFQLNRPFFWPAAGLNLILSSQTDLKAFFFKMFQGH